MQDQGLDNLLDLDGEIFRMSNGYSVCIRVREVTPNFGRPQGVKYSLTLHDQSGYRILGYDNAHAVIPTKKRFACNRTEWDHVHRSNKIVEYEYESAGQLLEDFWQDVDKMMRRVGG